MISQNLNHTIHLLEYITHKEYIDINHLKDICYLNDQTNLKLELDYKLNIGKNQEKGSNKINCQANSLVVKVNEFLYYIGDTLVAYLGISSFGANIGEINGMTHPDWRRKGLFKKLFEHALKECQNRNFSKLLLLSDGNESSGIDFIKAVGGVYDFSEYRMKQLNNASLEKVNPISLRIADKSDWKEIARQNAIYFNDTDITYDEPNEADTTSEADVTNEADATNEADVTNEEDAPNEFTYLAKLNGEIIGKIKIEFSDSSAFICGFGILPDYRGKGYGKATLKEALRLIYEKGINQVELDVECKNNNALNLYKSCGFEEMSVMNYYQYHIINEKFK